MFKLDGSAPGGNADTRRKYGHQVEMRIPDGSADAGEMRIPDGSAPGGNADTGQKCGCQAKMRIQGGSPDMKQLRDEGNRNVEKTSTATVQNETVKLNEIV